PFSAGNRPGTDNPGRRSETRTVRKSQETPGPPTALPPNYGPRPQAAVIDDGTRRGPRKDDMTMRNRFGAWARSVQKGSVDSATVFLRDVGQGLLEVSHNSLALLGLVFVGTLLFIGSRTELRHDLEARTLSWLQARHEARLDPQ